MKKWLNNCFASTGLTLILIAVIASLYHANFICVTTVYQSFLVNILIYIGLYFLQKYESKYLFLEFLIEILYILGILVPFGFLFNWYSSMPLWVVILLGIVVYFIACFINIIKINEDISFINAQIKFLKANDKKDAWSELK